ncbi:MAG: hypothetical protein AB7F79_04935 [Steroidobacteraceae bacterium]
MLRTLQLVLPALIPSWRFFDTIVASPRIQYALLDTEQYIITDWREFRPRPARVSLATMLRRMIWNPQWNEFLFMMSCAERIMERYTEHSETEILMRISNDWLHNKLPTHAAAHQLQFRLVFVERQGQEITQDIRFVSRLATLPKRISP